MMHELGTHRHQVDAFNLATAVTDETARLMGAIRANTDDKETLAFPKCRPKPPDRLLQMPLRIDLALLQSAAHAKSPATARSHMAACCTNRGRQFIRCDHGYWAPR